MKKAFFILMFATGLTVFIYLVFINNSYQSKLKEIKFKDELSLKVEKAYNERGIYVLNDSFFLSSATFQIDKNIIKTNNNAIWRANEEKYMSRISDISAPFTITKSKDSDTIFVKKDGNNFTLLLGTASN